MRYIISIIFSILVFVGCQKENIQQVKIVKPIEMKPIEKKKKENIIKKIQLEKKEFIPIIEDAIIEVKDIINDDIAIVYASKQIGKYAIEATNSAMVYLLNNKKEFSLNVFDIQNENLNSIHDIFDKLEERNISKVLFMITPKNVHLLYSYEKLDKFKIYLPLVNKYKSKYNIENIVFGGIDYKEQFEVLLSENKTHIVEIYDDSVIGNALHENLIKLNKNITSYKLSSRYTNFSAFFKKNKNITNSTLILNTPIIKSSILLSQLRANEIEVERVLSSQFNYSSLLLVLTQKKDRERLLIANYIDLLPNDLEAINIFLGNDILYNWVNYSVVLGMEYLRTNKNLLFDNIEILDNQVQYNIKLLSTKKYSFTNY